MALTTPRITKHLAPRECTFINQMNAPYALMYHRTAGHVTNQQLLDYWRQTCITAHFGINLDPYGDPYDIWQFVELWDGSGANCCTDNDAHPFFYNRGGNANTYTASCEVCTNDTGNRGLMTPRQEDALVYLWKYLCGELNIEMNTYYEWFNGTEQSHTWIHPHNGGMGMHRDIAPHNKIMCPGDPYYLGQYANVIARVKGANTVTWVPPHKDTWIIGQHEALARYVGKAPEIRDSGIFGQVRRLELEQNIVIGSPLGPEQDYDADWIVQYYTGGAVFWKKTAPLEYYVMSGSGEVSI